MNSTGRHIGIALLTVILTLGGGFTNAVADDAKQAEARPPSLDPVQAELTALLHYFLANSATEETHDKFWADELVYTSSNGTRFGKADIMAGFATDDTEEAVAEEEASDAPSMVFTGEDVTVQVYGTTAVVTFRLVGTPDDGSAPSEYFNSGTFVNRQGSWRAVAWQATIIPAED
jgi:hypothetical protein